MIIICWLLLEGYVKMYKVAMLVWSLVFLELICFRFALMIPNNIANVLIEYERNSTLMTVVFKRSCKVSFVSLFESSYSFCCSVCVS